MHLKYARCDAAVRGQEFHNYHEVVWLLGGDARFISCNVNCKLKAGTLVVIPKENFHQFVVENQNYTRLIFAFKESNELFGLISEAMREVRLIENPSEKLISLFTQLADAAKEEMEDSERELFFRAALVHLLVYLKRQTNSPEAKRDGISPTVREAIRLIEENYPNHLSLESIAASLHISPSTLSHKFSSELNISVYKYVTRKRLSAARKLIESGENMTVAASACGFSDYSCFYRLYKKFSKQDQ